MKHSIRTVEQLKEYVRIQPDEEEKYAKIIREAPLQVPHYYLKLIDKNDDKDPIKNLILPSMKELSDEGSLDTSGEDKNTKLSGLQHEYDQTALIIPTSTCAAYCRFCFRKRMVGKQSNEIATDLTAAYDYLREHKEIDNVLLTGGDPLTLSTKYLEKIISDLREIDSIKIIRFGTRVPVFLPQRISEDKQLLKAIKQCSDSGKKIYAINHFNHPREITKEAIKAQNDLLEAKAILANQTVLLRGVNDKPEIISELFNKLSYIGVTPYYLFQCRPVKHATHFAVPLGEGYDIYEKAKLGMSGLAKRAKYVMSHYRGKIEIVAVKEGKIYLKFHQARNREDSGKFLVLDLQENSTWIDNVG